MKTAASDIVKDYYAARGINNLDDLLSITVSFDQTFMKSGHHNPLHIVCLLKALRGM